MKNIKYNILLDTNIYESKNFELSTDSTFSYLQQNCDKGICELFSHSIIIQECKKHIEERVKSLKKLCKTVFKSLKDKEPSKFSDWIKEMEEITNTDYLRTFEEFIKNTKCTIISSKNLNVEKVLDQYFNKLPPFGSKGKKDEFPDAIVIESLRKYIDDNNEKFIVVSTDDDWKYALNGSNNITFFKDIKSAFNFMFNNVREEANKILDDWCNIDLVLDEVKTLLKDKQIYTDNFKDDFQVCDVNFDYPNICIYDYSKNSIVLGVDIDAIVEFGGKLFDETNSVYDSEIKDYTNEEYEDYYTDDRVNIEFNIILDLENQKYKIEPKFKDKNFYYNGSKLYL